MACASICAFLLSAGSALAQAPRANDQTVAEFMQQAPTALNPSSMPPPLAGLPGVSARISPLGVGLPPPANNSGNAFHLVGIFGNKGKSVAEFNIGGTVRYLELADRIKDGWLVERIANSSVVISRCPDKKPCQKKTLHMEAE